MTLSQDINLGRELLTLGREGGRRRRRGRRGKRGALRNRFYLPSVLFYYVFNSSIYQRIIYLPIYNLFTLVEWARWTSCVTCKLPKNGCLRRKSIFAGRSCFSTIERPRVRANNDLLRVRTRQGVVAATAVLPMGGRWEER